MRIPFCSLLECCLTSLPLLGCVGGYTALPPQARPPPIAFAATMPEQAVYTARATTPAAVLVVMPERLSSAKPRPVTRRFGQLRVLPS